MSVETNQLTGIALDWAYHFADLSQGTKSESLCSSIASRNIRLGIIPSGNPRLLWPILKEEVHTLIERDGVWEAEIFYPKRPQPGYFCYSVKGKTPEEAILRTFVASRVGGSVPVPKELVDED